jgi:hypothetical protein
MQRSQGQHMPTTTASAPSVSMSDTLLALLRDDAQPQETESADVPAILPQTRVINFCANCGRKLLPDDRFCSGCGKPVKR